MAGGRGAGGAGGRAVLPSPSFGAVTVVVGAGIDAGSPVVTWVRVTQVDVDLKRRKIKIKITPST